MKYFKFFKVLIELITACRGRQKPDTRVQPGWGPGRPATLVHDPMTKFQTPADRNEDDHQELLVEEGLLCRRLSDQQNGDKVTLPRHFSLLRLIV